MPQKVRIALDAMGGDVGASVVIPGAAIALSRHPETEFLLVGDRAQIEAQLAKHPAMKAASQVIHTELRSAYWPTTTRPSGPTSKTVPA